MEIADRNAFFALETSRLWRQTSDGHRQQTNPVRDAEQSRGLRRSSPASWACALGRYLASCARSPIVNDELVDRPTQALIKAARGKTLGALRPPFDGHSDSYLEWRDLRLRRHRASRTGAIRPVDIATCRPLSSAVLAEIAARVREHGFALYRFTDAALVRDDANSESLTSTQESAVAQLAAALGLNQHDDSSVGHGHGLARIEDRTGTQLGRFPPYRPDALNWHTDGYYRPREEPLRSFILHCVTAAQRGGSLTLLDPELLLIALNEHAPEVIEPLAATNAMTLPGNVDALGHCRPDRSVPLLYCHTDATLGMRFTTRTRNIHWRDAGTKSAAATVLRTINSPRLDNYRVVLRLESGQGIVSRNVLHARTAYVDQQGSAVRRILRGRYLDAVSTTKPCLRRSRAFGQAVSSILASTESNTVLELSEILIQQKDINSFEQLVTRVRVLAKSEMFFRMDIKPPYPDTPENWESVLEAAFNEYNSATDQ